MSIYCRITNCCYAELLRAEELGGPRDGIKVKRKWVSWDIHTLIRPDLPELIQINWSESFTFSLTGIALIQT